MDSHIFFFFFFPFPVSFVHNSNKINSLLLQKMLPNLTHQQRMPGAKICSVLLFIRVRLQASCHSREQPGFPLTIYQNPENTCFGDLACLSGNKHPCAEKSGAPRQPHPCGCLWMMTPVDAENSFVPSSSLELSCIPDPPDLMRRCSGVEWPGGNKAGTCPALFWMQKCRCSPKLGCCQKRWEQPGTERRQRSA